jgi:transposase InsO family protein
VIVAGDQAGSAPGTAAPRARRERRHRSFIALLVREGMIRDHGEPARRGPGWQDHRRERERRLRLKTLAYARWALWHHGWTFDRFCSELGIEASTLRGWRGNVGKAAEPLGAKPGIATLAEKDDIFAFLLLWKGDVTQRELKAEFPRIPRAELGRLHWAFHHNYGDIVDRYLIWNHTGTVWAMDYSHAESPIDGICPCLLVIRDLASGFILAALPTRRATAKQVRRLLRLLFVRHGPPLVIKTDNGSHFTEHRVQRLLADAGVTVLLSPARTPRYNGAIEAGIGALKHRIFHAANHRGEADSWTGDDLAIAREQANHTPCQALPHATPHSRWQARAEITREQRDAFLDKVAEIQDAMVRDEPLRGLEKPRSEATIRRHAIAAALKRRGYLDIRRRHVCQPLVEQKAG